MLLCYQELRSWYTKCVQVGVFAMRVVMGE